MQELNTNDKNIIMINLRNGLCVTDISLKLNKDEKTICSFLDTFLWKIYFDNQESINKVVDITGIDESTLWVYMLNDEVVVPIKKKYIPTSGEIVEIKTEIEKLNLENEEMLKNNTMLRKIVEHVNSTI